MGKVKSSILNRTYGVPRVRRGVFIKGDRGGVAREVGEKEKAFKGAASFLKCGLKRAPWIW